MLFETTIHPDDARQRADRYLRKALPHLPLHRLQSLFRRDEVKVGKRPVTGAHLLEAGETLRVYGLKAEEAARVGGALPAAVAGGKNPGAASGEAAVGALPARSGPSGQAAAGPVGPAPAEPFPFPVLFEDADMLVLDKPSGIAVHPGSGIEPGASLIEKVQAALSGKEDGWAAAPAASLFRPSLVHRLDRDTSGVLVLAKKGGALRLLNAALREGRFRKIYLALVEGRPAAAAGTIDLPLLRVDRASGAKNLTRGPGTPVDRSDEAGAGTSVHRSDEARSGETAPPRGGPKPAGRAIPKESVTHYKTLESGAGYSLLEVRLDTGRMHQIRAHLAGIGHAVVGDDRYGDFERCRFHRKAWGLRRLFLHAWKLEIGLPGETRRFRAPLPAKLSECLGRAGLSLPEPERPK